MLGAIAYSVSVSSTCPLFLVCVYECVRARGRGARLLEQPWLGGCLPRLPSSCPSDLMCSQSPWLSSSHKKAAYVCGGGGGCRGRRVIADYCYSSRHFISLEIGIAPPYWACYGTDLPSHTMFPLSTSDDQTAGPQILLLSKKLVKAPWDDAFHFWHFPYPGMRQVCFDLLWIRRKEIGLLCLLRWRANKQCFRFDLA